MPVDACCSAAEATQRAELIGVPIPSLKNWTTGGSKPPTWIWRWLLAWELLTAEGREEYRGRVRTKTLDRD